MTCSVMVTFFFCLLDLICKSIYLLFWHQVFDSCQSEVVIQVDMKS